MTDDDIARVRASFAVLAPQAQVACLAFYRHLFVLAPDCRAMFGEDLEGQARKLAGMLDALVGRLDDPAGWAAQCRALGQRHVGYGATEDHFDAVGAALLRMLHDSLGGLLLDVRHDNRRALGRELPSDLRADAAACSRDESRLPIEPSHGLLLRARHRDLRGERCACGYNHVRA